MLRLSRAFLKKRLNIRFCSIWLVLWGNLSLILDSFLMNIGLYSIESNWHYRIYYYMLIISFIICSWLYPKIPSRDALLAYISKQYHN